MRRPIGERFAAFRAENPDVEERLLKITRELVRRGHQVISIKMCWEWLRLEKMRTETTDGYRLCNDYTSRYARALMAEHPDLDGVFELRELREIDRLSRLIEIGVDDDIEVDDGVMVSRRNELDEFVEYMTA